MADLIITVPYDKDKNIGKEYNRIIKSCSCDWIGFMDRDIYLSNPRFYEIFDKAISVVGEKAGFISCMTNRIGCQLQRAKADTVSNDISYHIKYAEELYRRYGNEVQDVTDSQFAPSALIFVTSRKAWYDVNGFRENGQIGIDTDYVSRLKKKGYKVYILKGLYVYHWYRCIL